MRFLLPILAMRKTLFRTMSTDFTQSYRGRNLNFQSQDLRERMLLKRSRQDQTGTKSDASAGLW